MRRLTADRRVLAAIALLGLLLVGLGAYAIFREILTADITVETGKFDFDIVHDEIDIDEFAGNQEEDPDIAQCTATPQGENSVQISISKAYPLYRCVITLVFINDPAESNIPGRFETKDGPENPADWLSVSYEDPDPTVLIPVGEKAQATITIRVADQNVPEEGSVTFQVKYTFRQYLPYP